MAKDGKIDWFAFWVHFFFGALLGGVVGLGVWSRPWFGLFSSGTAGLICIGGGASLGGLIAGCARDEFWEGLRDSNWWRFWL